MAESTEGKGGILRKLILERDCWTTNFDLNAEFEFKTVYHISEYSYTMCSCAFEHEYFDYLLESGEVDKEMLEKLIKCINDGACPHVQDDDDDEFIAKTSVNGIHVLAALGDEKLLHTFNLNPAMLGEETEELENGIFELQPYVLAVLKNNPQVLDDIKDVTKFEIDTDWSAEMLYCIQQEENEAQITLSLKPLYKIALEKGNAELMN